MANRIRFNITEELLNKIVETLENLGAKEKIVEIAEMHDPLVNAGFEWLDVLESLVILESRAIVEEPKDGFLRVFPERINIGE